MKAPATEQDNANKPQGGLKAFLSECCEKCETPVYTNQSLALVKPHYDSNEEHLIHYHCYERPKEILLCKLKEVHLKVIASMEEGDVSDIRQNVSRKKMVELIEKRYSVAEMLAEFSYSKPKIERIKSLCSEIISYTQKRNTILQIMGSVLTLWPKAVITDLETEHHGQPIYSEEQLVDMLESLVKTLFDGINPAEKNRAEGYLELFLASWGQYYRKGASLRHLLVVLDTILKFPIHSKRTKPQLIQMAINQCIVSSYDVESTLSVLRQFYDHDFEFATEKFCILHWIIDSQGHLKSWEWILGVAEGLIELGAKTDINDNKECVPLEKVFIHAGLGRLDPDLLRKAFRVFSKNLKLRDEEGSVNEVLYDLYDQLCSELTNSQEKPNFPIIKEGVQLLLEQETAGSVPRFTMSDNKIDWTETPLHMICYKNSLTRAQAFEIATLFLNRDPKLRDQKGKEGATPLHLFCQHWGENAGVNEADTNLLLEQLRFFMKDAAVDVCDDSGATPLEYLASEWMEDAATPEVMTTAMKVLVQGGHNINASQFAHVTYPVIFQWIYHEISPQQILTTLKVLGELGAKFNSIFVNNTLLHYVVNDWMKRSLKFEDAFSVIEFLLASEVPLLQKNADSKTIVHIICENWLGNGINIKVEQIQKVLRLILPENGKDNKELLASEDKFGRTPLLVVGELWLRSWFGFGFEQTIEVLQFLKDRGALVKEVDRNNNNLLSYFVESWLDSKNIKGQELEALAALFNLAPKIKITVHNRYSTQEDNIDLDKGNQNTVTRRLDLNDLWKRFPSLAYNKEKFAQTPLHQIFSSERSSDLSMVVRCQLMRKLITHEFDIDTRHPKVDDKRIKYWLRLKNHHGDTPVMAAIKGCLDSKDFDYTEFRALLEDCFKNGAEINAATDSSNDVLILFFNQDLKRLSSKDIWNFVWFIKNQGYKFENPELQRYRTNILEAFIRANLEEAVPEFIEAWTFVHGLSGNDYLEVQCDGVTLLHIGARELNAYMFSDLLSQCSNQVLAEIIENECQNKSNPNTSSQSLAVVEQDSDKSQKQSLFQFCVRNNQVGNKNLLTVLEKIVGQDMLYRAFSVRNRSDSNKQRKVWIPFNLFHSNLYAQSRKQNAVDIFTLYVDTLKRCKKLDAMMRLIEWLREIDATLYRELNGWTLIQFFLGDTYDQSTFSPVKYEREQLQLLKRYSPFLTVGEKDALYLIFRNEKDITPEYKDPNSSRWIEMFKEQNTVFSSLVLARHYESGYLLGAKDPKKALEYYQRACTLPYSKENEFVVACRNFARNRISSLADQKQASTLLSRASVYQYEENFEEAVKECCDYLQTCDADIKAQSQGVNYLIAMKEPICTQKIQPARIVATLIQLTKERQFNRSLIAKMLKDFGLTWLFCYEYNSSIFYNGGSHKMTITRALIYLSLVNEKNQFFDTLKHRSQQDTPANKEWLGHLNEVLKAIKDPNNKDFPAFLRGPEILMRRVTELQQMKNSEHNTDAIRSMFESN
jgi:hypothetical protein